MTISFLSKYSGPGLSLWLYRMATLIFVVVWLFPSVAGADNDSDHVQLTQTELAWIQANPVVTVGIDSDFAPIEYLDGKGQYIGVTADFLRLIESKTGLTFKIEAFHTWEESIRLVREGKINMLGAAVSSPQRSEFINFTLPYARLSGVIIVQKKIKEPMSLGKLRGMKVAVVHNYIWKDILETDYPDLKIDPVPDIETALKKVSFGMADAMVGYMATASHHSERLGISNLRVSGETIGVMEISFGVNKQLASLRSILDKVLAGTTETQKKIILRKWVSLEFLPPNEFQKYKWLLGLVLISGAAILLGIKFNAQRALRRAYHELEKRVEERTAELSNTNEALKLAKEEADAATLVKSDFLANMSHEIRTPMNGVITASELAMNETLPPKIARYMEIINTSGHALLGVIDDILDFSKIEAGKLDMEHRPFHLGHLMALVADLFSHKITQKNIDFATDVSPDTPLHLVGDSFRLQQILMNLVGNAVKFTDQNGKIFVHVRGGKARGDDQVQLKFSVEDTGIGIAPEHQDLLFTPFSQIDASTTRKYGGSGLGLCICGQLVEMMGGKIRVQSQPGKGSSFIFTVILERSPIEITDTNFSLDSASHMIFQYRSLLEGKRLLVAEDNPINQEITLGVLELVGVDARLVDNGLDALAAVKEDLFDAILMDIQMPKMDGFEASRAIRRIKAYNGLPIIAMTAHTLKGDREKCMAAGMDGYISKPVSQEKLFAALKDVIHGQSLPCPVPPVSAEVAIGGANNPNPGSLPFALPGIDIHRAMGRLGADDAAFLRLLATFARNHQGMMVSIQAAWQDQDTKRLKTCLHSLKGASSGIGAKILSCLAHEYEQACQDGTGGLSLEKKELDILEKELNGVLLSIDTLLVAQNFLNKQTFLNKKRTDGRVASGEGAGTAKVLCRLKQALGQYELKAVETQFDLLESLCDHPVMEEIKGHIASFDYDHAQKNIETLISMLEE